jgi:NADH-quinone oxidoreductase subunit N
MIEKLGIWTVLPEIFLVAMTCVIAIVDLFVKSEKRSTTYALTLGVLAFAAWMFIQQASADGTVYAFGRMFVSDPMGNWLKAFACIATGVTLVYGRSYAADRQMLEGGELFSMSMFALLGMCVMISGNHFIVIYLGLELLTLSSYALVALRRDSAIATEAAMKYFVLGALASGFLLYGISMIYGATGSLELSEVFRAVQSGLIKHQVLVFGLVFVVAGLAFKLGVVPFHMWVPDVYHGAPTAVTLMIGGAPKLAAFGLVIRVLVEGLLPLAVDWQQMLAVLAVGSLLIGNLAAIAQTNVKRMLAFSTISQMGFVLIGLMAGVANGNTNGAANAYGSAMFYVVSYVLTTLATFGVILILAREGFENDEIDDFSGLNQRNPALAAVLAIALFSLAGIPPMVGFYAKLAVLQSLIASGQATDIGLAVFAVMMSLIGAFYYLRLVKVMYFDSPLTAVRLEMTGESRIVLSLNGLAILVLGILPGGLMALCSRAIVQTLAG